MHRQLIQYYPSPKVLTACGHDVACVNMHRALQYCQHCVDMLSPKCCWCHHHMVLQTSSISHHKNVLFSCFFFCYSVLYIRIVLHKRAQLIYLILHNCPANKGAGALCGIDTGAKMWCLFCVGANIKTNILCY